MKVLMTGATGFIGRGLTARLLRDGHQIRSWSRSPGEAKNALGADVEIVQAADDDRALDRAIADCDAVINLAGEPLFPKRWTDERRRALVDSRVGLTGRLSAAIGRATRRPTVFVSGSAVGVYGDTGDARIDESNEAGDDFLARLCVDWEAAAESTSADGVRVVTIRTGVVLGREGGALAQMRPAFALGAGGRIGSGRQYMPWIHLADLVELIATALVDDRYRGPINGTAPEAITNAGFTKALGRALRRPTVLPVPKAALKVLFGEASAVLLASQRVVPAAALERGFEFRFEDIDAALEDIVAEDAIVQRSSAGEPGRYLLEQQVFVPAPLDVVFDFFSKAENLGAITPPTLTFEHVSKAQIEMREGLLIDYRIALGPVPMRWTSRIDAWEPNRRFIDTQVKGPYAVWRHEHSFEARNGGTVMRDRVWYSPPLGPLGWIANGVFVAPMLQRIFGYRRQAIELRFGRPHQPVALIAA